MAIGEGTKSWHDDWIHHHVACPPLSVLGPMMSSGLGCDSSLGQHMLTLTGGSQAGREEEGDHNSVSGVSSVLASPVVG